MRFDTYELYYLDTYDEEAADLANDLGIEQDDPYFDEDIATHLDADYVIDTGLKVAVIVHDIDTHEVELAMLQPGSPQAPEWYSPEDAANVVAELGRILVALDDKTVKIVDPQDPAFALKRRASFQAEDMTTATVAMLQDSQDNALYTTFCIEFRPNMNSDFTFPVAIFAFDPRVGKLSGHLLIDDNPFAPPTFNRAQKKIVARRINDILESIHTVMHEERTISPFKNLGPQFRSEGLPSMEAVDTHHAIDQALEYLEQWWDERAS